mmetsp:Transcript_82964/g.268424  ORF Transcript_82964/g.268424 Transcript_82964/m.268424 type:complete len:212 (+) Transcript_82964:284-919(+)
MPRLRAARAPVEEPSARPLHRAPKVPAAAPRVRPSPVSPGRPCAAARAQRSQAARPRAPGAARARSGPGRTGAPAIAPSPPSPAQALPASPRALVEVAGAPKSGSAPRWALATPQLEEASWGPRLWTRCQTTLRGRSLGCPPRSGQPLAVRCRRGSTPRPLIPPAGMPASVQAHGPRRSACRRAPTAAAAQQAAGPSHQRPREPPARCGRR